MTKFILAALVKEGVAVDLVSANEVNLKLLKSGRIDSFPSSELSLLELAKGASIDFDSMERLIKLDKLSNGLNLAFSLLTPDETVEKCRAALDGMMKDGTFKRLTAKWHRR